MSGVPIAVGFEATLPPEKGTGFDMLQEMLDQKAKIEAELANLFAEELRKEVPQYLHTSQDAYLNAISVENGIVVLDTSDFVVNMVENGIPSFDMKPGLLNGPNVKTNKQGKKYAVVPISKYKAGRYNWRDKQTGKFSKGSNPGGDVELRVVSENSAPGSWIHPGHEGFHLVHNTLLTFDETIEKFVDEKINISLNNL